MSNRGLLSRSVSTPIPSTIAIEVIGESILTSTAASIVFSSIPATYRHLRLVILGRSSRGDATSDYLNIRFNGDTGNNYDDAFLEQTDTTMSSDSNPADSSILAAQLPTDTGPASAAGAATIDIPGYAQTVLHKSLVGHSQITRGTAAGDIRQTIHGGMWRSTAAINSITLFPQAGGTLAIGTIVTLYGLKGA